MTMNGVPRHSPTSKIVTVFGSPESRAAASASRRKRRRISTSAANRSPAASRPPAYRAPRRLRDTGRPSRRRDAHGIPVPGRTQIQLDPHHRTHPHEGRDLGPRRASSSLGETTARAEPSPERSRRGPGSPVSANDAAIGRAVVAGTGPHDANQLPRLIARRPRRPCQRHQPERRHARRAILAGTPSPPAPTSATLARVLIWDI